MCDLFLQRKYITSYGLILVKKSNHNERHRTKFLRSERVLFRSNFSIKNYHQPKRTRLSTLVYGVLWRFWIKEGILYPGYEFSTAQ